MIPPAYILIEAALRASAARFTALEWNERIFVPSLSGFHDGFTLSNKGSSSDEPSFSDTF